MANEPKISTSEIVYIGLVFILFDANGFALIWVGLDDVWILDILSLLSTFYLKMKGVSLVSDLLAKAIEAIPWVGVLPMYTIGWIGTIILDRSGLQEVTAVIAQKATAKPQSKPEPQPQLQPAKI